MYASNAFPFETVGAGETPVVMSADAVGFFPQPQPPTNIATEMVKIEKSCGEGQRAILLERTAGE